VTVDLACLVSGPDDGPALVLLHALGERAADWDVVAADFSDRRRVHAADLRGHGDSDWPGEYSLELMRDDVIAMLDAAGLRRVDLVGHSLGGVVAYLVAAAVPERVRRLVLEDVPFPRSRPVVAPERPHGDLDYDWDMVLAVRRQLDAPPPDWGDALSRVTAPTLVIWGGPRSPMSAERVGELAAAVPDGRLVTIDAGHLVHATRPAEFVAAVRPFLDEHDAG
jgi:3-oxoadipate enol-lactonase